MERERDEHGRFTETVTEERVLEALGPADRMSDPKSAQQVADVLGCTRQAADKKLRELEKDGKVHKFQFGPRSVAWQRTRVMRAIDEAGGGEA